MPDRKAQKPTLLAELEYLLGFSLDGPLKNKPEEPFLCFGIATSRKERCGNTIGKGRRKKIHEFLVKVDKAGDHWQVEEWIDRIKWLIEAACCSGHDHSGPLKTRLYTWMEMQMSGHSTQGDEYDSSTDDDDEDVDAEEAVEMDEDDERHKPVNELKDAQTIMGKAQTEYIKKTSRLGVAGPDMHRDNKEECSRPVFPAPPEEIALSIVDAGVASLSLMSENPRSPSRQLREETTVSDLATQTESPSLVSSTSYSTILTSSPVSEITVTTAMTTPEAEVSLPKLARLSSPSYESLPEVGLGLEERLAALIEQHDSASQTLRQNNKSTTEREQERADRLVRLSLLKTDADRLLWIAIEARPDEADLVEGFLYICKHNTLDDVYHIGWTRGVAHIDGVATTSDEAGHYAQQSTILWQSDDRLRGASRAKKIAMAMLKGYSPQQTVSCNIPCCARNHCEWFQCSIETVHEAIDMALFYISRAYDERGMLNDTGIVMTETYFRAPKVGASASHSANEDRQGLSQKAAVIGPTFDKILSNVDQEHHEVLPEQRSIRVRDLIKTFAGDTLSKAEDKFSRTKASFHRRRSGGDQHMDADNTMLSIDSALSNTDATPTSPPSKSSASSKTHRLRSFASRRFPRASNETLH
ncbi:uncharacterized protein B0I36DRAFT_332218 [Microdochium trichocladiopsis]|uniref:Bacteriophage T5 Orf172 DNA-binding domain-containing protein n=1 Tax=Microdochium trichocladiopsis TaxID=1682393 RepID=A0A9P8XZH5_9PEZI|nr:uncharacterized protein B0I36DRAFT_332218 [Microdochium trichocladiopsis]KAH7024915.1 hypothetical protein B0I36DRAFT_332218 [Microdochium trichocladiopsis]